jgi:hypothetical protein
MGQGLPYPAPTIVPWSNMFSLPVWTADEAFRDMAIHWYLDGLQAPDPTEIPYSWLAGALRFRQDKPFTHAAVGKEGGGTAIARVVSTVQTSYTATLQSQNDVDTSNLAHFAVTYYDEPRMRLAQVTVPLNKRSEIEISTILGVGVGTRIQLTDVPTGWPRGADSLVVEGIRHGARGNGGARVVTWSTSPVIGTEVGDVGPFFRVGVTPLDDETYLLPW